MRTAVKGLALQDFGLALRVGPDAPGLERFPVALAELCRCLQLRAFSIEVDTKGTWQKTNTVCYTLYK